jgi:hypothetical protein
MQMLEHREREHEVEARIRERERVGVRDDVQMLCREHEGVRSHHVRSAGGLAACAELQHQIAARERLVDCGDPGGGDVVPAERTPAVTQVDSGEIGVGDQDRHAADRAVPGPAVRARQLLRRAGQHAVTHRAAQRRAIADHDAGSYERRG